MTLLDGTSSLLIASQLSVSQSMVAIVVSRFIMYFWATLVAWAGLKFHIGYTVQNRYSWGMRASYIPLLQRGKFISYVYH
jgi:nucleobase:cation symporter-1, NCS1 family